VGEGGIEFKINYEIWNMTKLTKSCQDNSHMI
jgi:hypothetical protein